MTIKMLKVVQIRKTKNNFRTGTEVLRAGFAEGGSEDSAPAEFFLSSKGMSDVVQKHLGQRRKSFSSSSKSWLQ
jgi:hypothetical protein